MNQPNPPNPEPKPAPEKPTPREAWVFLDKALAEARWNAGIPFFREVVTACFLVSEAITKLETLEAQEKAKAQAKATLKEKA